MSNLRVKQHPTLGILIGTDGHVMVPGDTWHNAHWTYGSKDRKGYRAVMIAGKRYLVHRLVAQTFIGPIPQGYQIDHANRVRDDNRLENIRICTPIENRRNRADHDLVEAQGRTHFYEDANKAAREHVLQYYYENQEKVLERVAHYNQAKRKTHRKVRFADGSSHWVPLTEAEAYLIIPLKERNYAK